MLNRELSRSLCEESISMFTTLLTAGSMFLLFLIFCSSQATWFYSADLSMLNLLPVIVSPLLYMQLLIVSHMIMFILTAYMC